VPLLPVLRSWAHLRRAAAVTCASTLRAASPHSPGARSVPPARPAAASAPAEPPQRAQELPPAPAPVRCAPACARARPAAQATSHPSSRRAAAARLEPPAPARPRASAAQLLPSPGLWPPSACACHCSHARARAPARLQQRPHAALPAAVWRREGGRKQRCARMLLPSVEEAKTEMPGRKK
jgi:hypothetical protein